MSRFNIIDTPLAEVKVLERKPIEDDRGFLARLYCKKDLEEAGCSWTIDQINHTKTYHKGAVRGMHYQLPPFAEDKFVSCVRGAIWDVAVDLRPDSPTYLQWHAELLSETNHRSLLVPKGFAHGFQAQSDQCEVIYLVSEYYSPEYERGLNPLDQTLNIQWPLEVAQLSGRDQSHKLLDDSFEGVKL